MRWESVVKYPKRRVQYRDTFVKVLRRAGDIHKGSGKDPALLKTFLMGETFPININQRKDDLKSADFHGRSWKDPYPSQEFPEGQAPSASYTRKGPSAMCWHS